ELHLFGTRVTDAGLTHLAKLPALARLNLGDTRISAKGFATLKAAMSKVEVGWWERNRRVAEWVLALGGHARIRIGGEKDDRLVGAIAQVPAEYFQVTHISLAGVKKEFSHGE